MTTTDTQKKLKVDHYFDPQRCRHYLNGYLTVLHCHHFTSLYSQLADDARELNGPQYLSDAVEESFYPMLAEYFGKNNIQSVADRKQIAQELWQHFGMGIIEITSIGNTASTAEMAHSHVDEGWLKKWKKHTRPINFITQGYLAGAIAAILDKPIKSYKTVEIESIVCGAQKSRFNIVSK